MTNNDFGDEIITHLAVAPAYHKVGPQFIRKLKAALDKAECAAGQTLQQKEFGSILGVPKSTVHDWAEGALSAQIKALFCGLERLPESQQVHLLREFCRDCPRLDHPSLAHNQEAVKALRQALLQRSGLTFIQGSPERACTFLFTAIGNSIQHLSPKGKVCGIDVHFPVDFSPIPGVCYVRQNTSPQITQGIVRQMWPRLRRREHQLLMLNGAIAHAPELGPEVLSISNSRLVVLTGTSLPFLKRGLRSPGQQATFITVSVDSRRPKQIDVGISYTTIGG